MRIAEIMTTDVQSVAPNTDLITVAKQMKDLDVGVIPVVEGQRLAGNTLIVERGSVLIRVEGRLSRDRALRIADSTTVARVRP